MNLNTARYAHENRFSSSNTSRRSPFVRPQRTLSSSRNERKIIQNSTLNNGNLKELTCNAVILPKQSGTSKSSCSYSVMTLEETITDVMSIRMQSLADLSSRIEELSQLHRQEEELFRKQIGDVLQQVETTRISQLDTENDYEALLKKERTERQTVMSLMQRFKTEGAQVINTMKESLKEAKEKWKIELERNAILSAQLRKYSKKNSLENNEEVNKISEFSKCSECKILNTKLQTLTRLIEEEDSIIVELQQRNKSLEKKVSVLTQQRNRLLDLEFQQIETEEFNTEYNNLLNQVHGSEVNENEISFEKRVEVLTRFTKMLLQRLQGEQRQRLRVEEQTVRMASDHDQVVRALETRIKSIESSKTGRLPSYRRSSSCTDIEQPYNIVLNNENYQNTVNDEEISSAWEQEEGEKEKPQINGDEDTIKTISSNSVKIIASESHISESKAKDSPNDNVHSVLEAQLISVTSDFQQSIAEWSAISLNEGKPLRQEDFYPD